MSPTDSKRSSTARLWLVTFLIFVVVPGALIGIATAPGEWYAGLVKPDILPPDWVFPFVWMVLYVLIAISGWLTFIGDPDSPAMWAWIVQLALNWLWAPVFFGLKLIVPAVVVISAMLAAIIMFMIRASRVDRRASLIFVPYAVWVVFALFLNARIAMLN